MSKSTHALAAVCLTGLVSCFYPPPDLTPPGYRPIPSYSRPPQPSYDTGYDIPPPPPPPRIPTRPDRPDPPATSVSGNYPTAERTANPDQVLSPFEPYNVIDVAGFRSGQLARDPSNNKIFRIP